QQQQPKSQGDHGHFQNCRRIVHLKDACKKSFGFSGRPTPALSHRYVFSCPTTSGSGARPSGRFTVCTFLGSGNSATSQVCARPKRRKRRAPFVCVATTLNRYSHPMGEGESSSAGRPIQTLWKLRARSLAVPSPVGRE